jgi:hypothetical protein
MIYLSMTMFTILYFLLLLFTGILLSICVILYKKNQVVKKKHALKVQTLQKSIKLHKHQIEIRNKNLNKYQFLTYNLDESLRVQTRIQLL